MFALVVQLTGIMLYGYCLGAIAATLTNAASFRSVIVWTLFSRIVLGNPYSMQVKEAKKPTIYTEENYFFKE